MPDTIFCNIARSAEKLERGCFDIYSTYFIATTTAFTSNTFNAQLLSPLFVTAIITFRRHLPKSDHPNNTTIPTATTNHCYDLPISSRRFQSATRIIHCYSEIPGDASNLSQWFFWAPEVRTWRHTPASSRREDRVKFGTYCLRSLHSASLLGCSFLST